MNKEISNKENDTTRQGGNKAMGLIARILAGVLGGSILTRENVVKSMPYLLFLAILALFYISNTYYAEKTIVQSYALRKELKELRYEFVSKRSSLMFESKQSEVARRLESSGIKESRVPPVKLIVNKEKN